MNAKHLLTIYPDSLPPGGIDLAADIAAEDLNVPEDDRLVCAAPIKLRLHVSLVHGGILAEGSLHSVLRCRCDRCLTYYDHDLTIGAVCHFSKSTDNEPVDLTDDIRQDILLAFPQQCLCRENCAGLCSNCGQNLNVRDCGCQHQTVPNDTWHALDKLQFNGDPNSNASN
ncbi:MAG: DUF177 domain-containing protein [Candidatus Pacebacteria bacterium]|nr:DUF177 domain-containing protein [Candidatus Paceibacterota bacterium]